MSVASGFGRKERFTDERRKATRVQARGKSPAVRSLRFDGTSCRQNSGSFYGHGGSSRGTYSDLDQYWQPGQRLPLAIPHSPVASSTPRQRHQSPPSESLVDMLHNFQDSMETQFRCLSSRLGKIDERMDALEGQQKAMQEQLQNSSISSSSTSTSTPSSSSSESTGRKRGRVTPTALQSKIRLVHASFDDDKQLDLSEPINSKHNSGVVQAIISAIGCEQFAEDLIRKGCKTYRKTLCAKEKHVSTPIKRRKQERSRKQRSYERRGKVCKPGREVELWADVYPEMMSDEEKEGEEYVRHQPTYRSKALSSFISKLDERLDSAKDKHPRVSRMLGSPREKPLPEGCKKWLVKKELWNSQCSVPPETNSTSSDDGSSGSEELFD